MNFSQCNCPRYFDLDQYLQGQFFSNNLATILTLKCQPHKMVKHTKKQFVSYFVGLALKVLITIIILISIINATKIIDIGATIFKLCATPVRYTIFLLVTPYFAAQFCSLSPCFRRKNDKKLGK